MSHWSCSAFPCGEYAFCGHGLMLQPYTDRVGDGVADRGGHWRQRGLTEPMHDVGVRIFEQGDLQLTRQVKPTGEGILGEVRIHHMPALVEDFLEQGLTDPEAHAALDLHSCV